MNNYISFNGKILPAEQALIGAGSRGLRYGDGLFETMRVVNGRIILQQLHMERLLAGLSTLQFELPAHLTTTRLAEDIKALCRKMNIEAGARIRLNAFRGNGGLYDPESHLPNIVIEAWPLETPARLNENGLDVGVYGDVRKSRDILSSLKTNNYLPYIMAALHAKSNHLNDCLLLNDAGRICDATIANVWWVKQGRVYTPPLSEGGVAGVMRKHLLLQLPGNYPVQEEIFTIETLAQADEIFLSNAIQGIRWVKACGEKQYTHAIADHIFRQSILPLWKQ